MNEDPLKSRPEYRSKLAPKIHKKEARKLRARQAGRHHPLQAVGLFGVVGWSVALPTLLSLALGIWIDRTWPSSFSWTLLLLLVGIILGCWNAWKVIQRELGMISTHKDQDAPKEVEKNDRSNQQ
jgi:ATP synthase protein I